MNSSIRRLGVVNANLQNVNTVAYKQINPDSVMFSDILQEMFRDDEKGPMLNTGNKLDIALSQDNAYFLVEGESGPERTRDGSFHINPEGKVVNFENKELVVIDRSIDNVALNTSEELSIDRQGQIKVAGKYYGRVAVDYEGKQPGQIAQVYQGKLEGSNVNLINSVMEISKTKRHLDTMQNMLSMDLNGEKDLIERYGRNV